MVFSSLAFILLFFPAVTAIYYLCPKKARNYWLLIASLFFYGYGEPALVGLLVLEILWNYFWGLALGKSASRRVRTFLLVICLVGDIGALAWFKYAGFLYENLSNLFGLGGSIPEIALPIGISFYTFQGISYVVDVWRGTVEAQKNPFYLGLYISLFPQLIAGPIVRYKDIAEQITHRRESLDGFVNGFFRFCVGLCKKVLIANQLGLVTDFVFSDYMALDHAGALTLLSAVAFTLQLYFDFSGYSDMAIGLSGMFGFHLSENFNYPYLAVNAKDFWRRWHISLSSWFRDYVYIPLGGSWGTMGQTVRNMLIVWLLTGLWHGANWPCVIWGLAWGTLLILEKTILHPDSRSRGFRIVYRFFLVFFVVMVTPLLQMTRMEQAATFYREIFTASGWSALSSQGPALRLWLHDQWLYLLAGLLISRNFFGRLRERLSGHGSLGALLTIAYDLLILIGAVLSVSAITYGSYNPFLYFQF